MTRKQNGTITLARTTEAALSIIEAKMHILELCRLLYSFSIEMDLPEHARYILLNTPYTDKGQFAITLLWP